MPISVSLCRKRSTPRGDRLTRSYPTRTTTYDRYIGKTGCTTAGDHTTDARTYTTVARTGEGGGWSGVGDRYHVCGGCYPWLCTRGI